MMRVSSIFSQMLQLFSRTEFERAVAEHRAERHARGFSCWGQFVAMLFCHLGRAQSSREICGGLAVSEGKLRHLGLPDTPKRSTLAYANEHRPWQLYLSVFYQLLGRCREVAGSHGFRFKNKPPTLDATLIELCASVFDWAQFWRTKGAVKLHLLLDHPGLLPSFALITEGRVHESRVARSLRFEPGTIVVFDRGFADYDGFASLDAEGRRPSDQPHRGTAAVERRAGIHQGLRQHRLTNPASCQHGQLRKLTLLLESPSILLRVSGLTHQYRARLEARYAFMMSRTSSSGSPFRIRAMLASMVLIVLSNQHISAGSSVRRRISNGPAGTTMGW